MNMIKIIFNSFKDGMKEFGETIAIIINSLLLSVVYFVGVGLTSLFIKLGRKTLMKMEISNLEKSYWEPIEKKKIEKEDFYRRF